MNKLNQVRKPKILAYDIECTGTLGYAYGTYKTNVHKIVEQPILLSFSYAWYENGKKPQIKCVTLADSPTYKKNPKDDKYVTEKLHELFDQADITLGHNSKSFDDKMSNMFFLKHMLPPVKPHKQLDTMRMARSIGRWPSTSLNNLSDFFGIGGKTAETHASLWWDSINGGPDGLKAMKKMKKYNNQDVVLTVKLYEILRPYYRAHPSMSRITGIIDACDRCGSFNYRTKAYRKTNVMKYRQYVCNDCGGYFNGRKAIKESEGDVRPKFKNV